MGSLVLVNNKGLVFLLLKLMFVFKDNTCKHKNTCKHLYLIIHIRLTGQSIT